MRYRRRWLRTSLFLACTSVPMARGQSQRVAPFAQEVRVAHDLGDIRSVAIDDRGKVWAAGPGGLRFFDGAAWSKLPNVDAADEVASSGGAVWFISRGGLWKARDGSVDRIADLQVPAVHLTAGDRVLV